MPFMPSFYDIPLPYPACHCSTFPFFCPHVPYLTNHCGDWPQALLARRRIIVIHSPAPGWRGIVVPGDTPISPGVRPATSDPVMTIGKVTVNCW